jgi:hypothetical protein
VIDILETDLERHLRVSLAPLAEEAGFGMAENPWICGYAGWRSGRDPTPALLDALEAAYPFPDTIAAVWGEHCSWQKLRNDRAAAMAGYEFPAHVAARIAALEFVMDNIPDPTAEGLRARFAWLSHLSKSDAYRTCAEDSQLAQRLAVDFEGFAKAVQPARHLESSPAATSRQTQADRRAAVLSILGTAPDLSDREIGRRVGVSPQTVSNWRKKLSAGCPS